MIKKRILIVAVLSLFVSGGMSVSSVNAAGLPDLIVQKIEYRLTGDVIYPASLLITVCNEGESDFINQDQCNDAQCENEKPFIKWGEDGKFTSYIYETSNAKIDSGDCKDYSGNLELKNPGSYDFTVSIDPDNYAREAIENNNNLFGTITVTNNSGPNGNPNLPDLTVSNLKYRLTNDKLYPAEIVMDICNNGQTEFINPNQCITNGNDVSCPGQKPLLSWGESRSFSTPIFEEGEVRLESGMCKEYIGNISPKKAGDYYLQVFVDPDNYILESDESNNEWSRVLTITESDTALSDLIPISLSIKNTSRPVGQGFYYGDIVNIKSSYKNAGEGSADGFILEINGYNDKSSVRREEDKILPRQTVLFETTIMWPSNSTNNSTLSLILDIENKVSETDEQNNILSIPINDAVIDAGAVSDDSLKEFPNVIENQLSIEKVNSELVAKVDNRGKLFVFFVGPDYVTIEALKEIIKQNNQQISDILIIKKSLQDDRSKDVLDEQVKKLSDENLALQKLIFENEGKFSLFGWLVKLF